MKASFLLMFCLASLCCAQDTNITTKVTARDRDGDGKTDLWMETVRRGDSLVLMTIRTRETNGVIGVARTVTAGDATMTEIDADGDGHFETVAIHGSEAKSLEVFKRQKNGSLKPVSAAQLDLHRQLLALNDDVSKFMRSTIDGTSGVDEAMRQVKQTREKVDALTQRLKELEQKETQP